MLHCDFRNVGSPYGICLEQCKVYLCFSLWLCTLQNLGRQQALCISEIPDNNINASSLWKYWSFSWCWTDYSHNIWYCYWNLHVLKFSMIYSDNYCELYQLLHNSRKHLCVFCLASQRNSYCDYWKRNLHSYYNINVIEWP